MPRVSVIIPVFNRAHTIARTLASVESQTFSDWEIVLVDDGSSDDSVAIASQAAQGLRGPVRIFQQANQGPAAARNRGLAEATGEMIALLDSDDVFLPGSLQQRVDYLDAHPEVGLVFMNFQNWTGTELLNCHADGCPRLLAAMKLAGAGNPVFFPKGKLFDLLVRENCVGFDTIMFRREILPVIGHLDETLHISEDLDFMFRVGSRFTTAFLPSVGLLRRFHTNNMTSNVLKMLPFSILVRERQRPIARDEDTRGALEHEIAIAVDSYGYQLRKAGEFRRSIQVYAKNLRQGQWVTRSLSGILKTAVAGTLTTLGLERNI